MQNQALEMLDGMEKEKVKDLEELKDNVKVVLLGDCSAGKSTIAGHINLMSGKYDPLYVEDCKQRMALEGKQDMYLSFMMNDTGIRSYQVSREAVFETERRIYTIVDTTFPVSSLINGASQADIAILVVSVTMDDFEFISELLQIVKGLGVDELLVVVNEMDYDLGYWCYDRFESVCSEVTKILKKILPDMNDVVFIPLSGLRGLNVKSKVDKKDCSWWDGPFLFEALDSIELAKGDREGLFRMPIDAVYSDYQFEGEQEGGMVIPYTSIVTGRVKSGTVQEGDELVVMPEVPVKVEYLFSNGRRIRVAGPGDCVRIRLSGTVVRDFSDGGSLLVAKHGERPPGATNFSVRLHIVGDPVHLDMECTVYIQSFCKRCKLLNLQDESAKAREECIPKVEIGQEIESIIEVLDGVIWVDDNSRFILMTDDEDPSERLIIAVGSVLERVPLPQPPEIEQL